MNVSTRGTEAWECDIINMSNELLKCGNKTSQCGNKIIIVMPDIKAWEQNNVYPGVTKAWDQEMINKSL